MGHPRQNDPKFHLRLRYLLHSGHNHHPKQKQQPPSRHGSRLQLQLRIPQPLNHDHPRPPHHHLLLLITNDHK